MSIKCDVLVIGAGPAGSSAARAAAMNGAKTIFIDKKEEIGNPVKCAEGIGDFLFPYLPFRIPKEQLIWEMDGMFFWTDDISIEKRGDFWKSYSVDRKKFDKWLSELAINNGAELFTNTELTDIELDEENNIKKAIVKRNNKPFEILPKVVVAADGVESTVLNLLGLYNPKRGDIAEVYSWEMKNLDLYKPQLEQVFIGPFAPGGYGYIFPKSKKIANVGIGGTFPEKRMESYFEEFLEIEHVKKQLKNAEYTVEKSQKAAIGDLTDKWIYNNIIITGDAANHNLKPFIEGILPSIICGDITGKKAFDISKGKKITHEIYLNNIKEVLDENYEISKQLQEFIFYIFSKNKQKKYLQFYGLVTGLIEPDKFEDIESLNYSELKTSLMRKINEQ
jgi:digeranylgeranylglycerophospholipid reductase